jgi:hypothetical protein
MVLPVETEFGPIKVEIAWATVSLVRKLQRASDAEVAAEALEEADRKLDIWDLQSRARAVDDPRRHHGATLSFGVNVYLPAEVGPR